MEEILRSIRAYLYEKSVSPLAGAFVLAWLILNYRVIVILLSGDHYNEKFETIDEYFCVSVTENVIWLNHLAGKLLRGFVYPAALAFAYIFVYPFAAAPVYEFALRRSQKLRGIKQKSENARILTVKESRDLYQRLAEMEALHNEETDRYQRRISSLQETNKGLASEIENFPASEAEFDDGHRGEADIEEYDNFIDRTVADRSAGQFTLADIFTASRWKNIPVSDRQQLGKRFKTRVDRGDFVNVQSAGRNSRNEAQYEKGVLSEQESEHSSPQEMLNLSANETTTLQMAAGLKANYGIMASNVAEELNVHLEESRLILGDLADKSLMQEIGETDDEETLYSLSTEGRRFLVSNDLIPSSRVPDTEQPSLLHADELEDFRNTIAKNKLNEADFEMQEDEFSGYESRGIEPLTGSVTITYIPTQISKKYSTGHRSSWPYIFEQDVVRGAFLR